MNNIELPSCYRRYRVPVELTNFDVREAATAAGRRPGLGWGSGGVSAARRVRQIAARERCRRDDHLRRRRRLRRRRDG